MSGTSRDEVFRARSEGLSELHLRVSFQLAEGRSRPMEAETVTFLAIGWMSLDKPG